MNSTLEATKHYLLELAGYKRRDSKMWVSLLQTYATFYIYLVKQSYICAIIPLTRDDANFLSITLHIYYV